MFIVRSKHHKDLRREFSSGSCERLAINSPGTIIQGGRHKHLVCLSTKILCPARQDLVKMKLETQVGGQIFLTSSLSAQGLRPRSFAPAITGLARLLALSSLREIKREIVWENKNDTRDDGPADLPVACAQTAPITAP